MTKLEISWDSLKLTNPISSDIKLDAEWEQNSKDITCKEMNRKKKPLFEKTTRVGGGIKPLVL